jgi:type VI secretion system secreted protein VgrG
VQANAVALSSWDPAALVAPSAEQQSSLACGDLPAISIHDGSGECIASGPAAPGGTPDDHGRLMLQALEAGNKVFDGAGAVRRLAAGHAFALLQHAHYPHGANDFTVLWVEHAGRNNVRSGLHDAGDGTGADLYRNTFACVRAAVALVPPATAAAPPCTAHGTQSALVVGLPDAVATTTRDHMVKIQFAWQRGARPNPGGLAHPGAGGGNAPGDATCGAWVRVAEALAGPNWGSQFIPRIGTEVLVAFIEGDIDRPVIVGQLHNGVAPPPFTSDADADAGVLSGIETQSFDGSGFNQWQLDDTQNQLRMRLASSAASSELHLGHLVEQADGSAVRGAARGSGFELRTDAWAVVRGAQGVLLSTSARPVSGSGVTSTQMDVQETVALYKGAASMHDALMQAALQQAALVGAAASDAQAHFIAGADPHARGKYEGAVNGQAVAKAGAGTRELDASQPVERLANAAVLFDAAAAMNWATPASTVISAGQHVHWSTQSDMHMAAGATLTSVAGASASLFTHAGGVQVIAANGPVSLQAHTDALEIVADKEVVVISVEGSISISASEKIMLQAGISSITLEDGDITFACPGNFTVKGGQHAFHCGGQATASFAPLPSSVASFFNRKVKLIDVDTGSALADIPYFLRLENGVVFHGVTDKDGFTSMAQGDSEESVKAYVGHAALKEIEKFAGKS